MAMTKDMFRFVLVWIAVAARTPAASEPFVAEYYTEPPLFNSRPDPRAERHFGHVGVTGLKLRIYPGVILRVEETVPGTPAAGKFEPGDEIVGVNGVALQGRNPYVALGTALTEAEASDGRLVIEVRGKAPVTVQIPALGPYRPTWPLDCPKSSAIVKSAAEYYARTLTYAGNSATDREEEQERHGIGGALACLFLLSTGDDRYLPRVKAYFDELGRNLAGIGDNTWNNGYNGIACAEYYLRTGDRSALPILQYYCDNARERQFYGIGWGHWGRQINPQYVAGGLMNPAGAQVATTLVLARECGVRVDEQTLRGALQYFYRFAGHGSVAYGDHRGEGGLGSNGKDGMVAALMQAATAASGRVEAYRCARDALALGLLDSYPTLVTGHGDEGRGDAIWRGIASAYVLDFNPAAYRATMRRLQWWYDLSRRPSGALGAATCQRFDDEGTGAGVALAYTAPLKTLRITGAPRSKYAKRFALPEHPWGRPADMAFLSVEPWTDEPVHVPYHKLGNAYSTPGGWTNVPRSELLGYVRHRNYVIRTQAAKALRHGGAFDDLEKLLDDQDPRVRRAALDGLTDYRYWFAIGRNPIRAEDVSPAMLASLRRMLADPAEALYVVDGALLALSRAPAGEIAQSLPSLLPWTTHEEWWLRQGAFLALAAAAADEGARPNVLPVLAEMLLNERRPQARESMAGTLTRLAEMWKNDPAAVGQIAAAFQRAAERSAIAKGPRAGEGSYAVQEAALAALKVAPERAPDVARTVRRRLRELEIRHIVKLVDALLATGQDLTEPLYGDYRRELIRRLEAGAAALDTILKLTQLKHPEVGWRELGQPPAQERVWHFASFEPVGADALHPREGKRFRDVTLPAGWEGWSLPEFDAGHWQRGQAPIGKGEFRPKRGQGQTFENRSTWGEGEFLLARTAFELDALDCDFYRLGVLAKQGFHIYLNGQRIHTYIWWNETPEYRKIGLGPAETKALRKGVNVLAVYANAGYVQGAQVGQLDVRLEGLKKAELLRD